MRFSASSNACCSAVALGPGATAVWRAGSGGDAGAAVLGAVVGAVIVAGVW